MSGPAGGRTSDPGRVYRLRIARTPQHLYDLVAVGNRLFFKAWTDPFSGDDVLFVSDGTEKGTERIFGEGSELTPHQDRLFFVASAEYGNELYVSDGTMTGTAMVKDIRPAGSSGPRNLTVIGDTLHYSAADDVHGRKLWKSDGTVTGTVMVKDMAASPVRLYAFAGRLFFPGDDGIAGWEPWVSDGTESGAYRMIDINPGPHMTDTNGWTPVSDRLYFTAYNPPHQLWTI